MPERVTSSTRPAKKRRLEGDANGEEDDCEIIDVTPLKRAKTDAVPHFFNTVFKKFSEWFKKTSQTNTRLFGALPESNSAAEAIAHGGQYLDEASTDKFMPRQNLNRNGVHNNIMSSTNQPEHHDSKETSADSLHQGARRRSTHLTQGVYVNNDGFCDKADMRDCTMPSQSSTANQKSTSRLVSNSEPSRVPCTTAAGLFSYSNSAADMSCLHHNSSYDQALNNSSTTSELLNGSLQKSYIDKESKLKSSNNKLRSSIYDKTFSERPSQYIRRNEKEARNQQNVKNSFDLDEKERYKRLLQQFALTDIPSPLARSKKSLARMSTRPATSTMLDQPLSELFTVNNCSAVLPSHSQVNGASAYTTAPSYSSRTSNYLTTKSSLHDKISIRPETNKPSEISLRCNNLVKKMEELKQRSLSRMAEQKGLRAEEMKLAQWDKLRASEDEHLERMVQQRLQLSAKVILEDLPPPDEPEYDEFPELSDEAEMVVNKALSRGPNNILSEAFRLKIKRDDMATLSSLNWLNDEVVNFYFNLIQDRSSQDDALPNVYVFNTFFYPKIMKDGHKGVKRWTKQVDLFTKQLILIPIHLGMHWCLACINLRDKRIEYFDSMGGNNTPCLEALRRYIEDESLDKKQQTLDTSDWTLQCVKDIPQQMNGSDCGVFSCKYAEYLSRDAPFTFSQENMPYFRRRMVYEIISKKLL